MPRGKKHCVDARLDVRKILEQAKLRWLRPAEVWEVIRNYQLVGLSSEVAYMPPSGELFLYNQKELGCPRKDGHNWKKPKDGKAVKEPHERLKVAGVGCLRCYYAHGEENENFQKRRYSMIEHVLSHIVLVHYQESQIYQRMRTSFKHVNDTKQVVLCSNEAEELASTPEIQNCILFSSNQNDFQMHSQAIDGASLNTAQASEFKNAKSVDNHQSTLLLLPLVELQRRFAEKTDAEFSEANYAMAYSKNQQINSEAKQRWLLPAEIYEILQNHENYLISSEPANMPPGGSLFLFNRKVHRHFRRDGHNWRKKKDGKTLSEANEKLKVGNDNLFIRCYYAIGENNENFRRRIYWIFDEVNPDIVLIHYLEEQGKRKIFNNVRKTEIEMMNSVSPSFNPSNYQMQSQATDLTSLGSAEASEVEELEPVDGYQEKLSTIPLVNGTALPKSLGPLLVNSNKQNDLQFHLPSTSTTSNWNDNIEVRADRLSASRPMLEGSFGDLEKNGSFNQWMSQELEDLDESKKQFSSGGYWDTLDSGTEVDESSDFLKVFLGSSMLLPSLSHDQLFSTVDISPTWAYGDSSVKVSITGKFLKSQHGEGCNWSCMFQEIEVPAMVVADDVLQCDSPIHKAGRVPFYVTCSNRLACREFEYRVAQTQDVEWMGKTDQPRSGAHLNPDMKYFDPTNGLNELSENQIGLLYDCNMGYLDSKIGPFTLTVPRPMDDCKLLSFIFEKSTRSDDQRYTLVKTDSGVLTRHLVWSLNPNGWLCGDLIDVFAEYLWMGGSKHDIYFPSTFSNKVHAVIGGRKKTIINPIEFAEFVGSLGLEKFDKHISQCRKMFLPLYDVNHWYLLVVHIDSQVAELWDSLNPTSTRFDHCKDVLEALDILYDNVDFQWLRTKKFSYYKLYAAVQCPRQVGSSDCGVYVVRHMQSYGKEWWLKFESQEQRMDLALALVSSRYNLALKDVLADMNASTAAKTTSRNCSRQAYGQCQQTSTGSLSCPMDQTLHYNVTTELHEGVDGTDSDKQNGLRVHLPNTDTISKRNDNIIEIADHPSATNPMLEYSFGDGLEKFDSFKRWMSELEFFHEPLMSFSSGACWDSGGSEMVVD